jgi:hypothetical protein
MLSAVELMLFGRCRGSSGQRLYVQLLVLGFAYRELACF